MQPSMPFCAVLSAFGIVLSAQETQESAAGSRPSSRPQAAEPVRPAIELERLEELAVDARSSVAKVTGLRFGRAPGLLAPHAEAFDEWMQIMVDGKAVTEDMSEDQRWWKAENTLGIYLPETHQVALGHVASESLLRPPSENASSAASRKREFDHAFLALVHEMAHALQEEHFSLNSKRQAATVPLEKSVLTSLSEGHATLVQELVAEQEVGIENFMRFTRRMHFENGRPHYITGHNYLAHIYVREGMVGVHERLAAPPTFEQFMEYAFRPPPERWHAKSAKPVDPVVDAPDTVGSSERRVPEGLENSKIPSANDQR